jgi:hypothetical protein
VVDVSNLGDVSNANSDATNIVGGAIGLAADLSGAIGLAVEVVGFLAQLATNENASSAAMAEIVAAVKALADQIAAGDLLDHFNLIDGYNIAGKGVYDDLPSLIALSNPDPSYLEQQIQYTLDSVLNYENDAAWRVVAAGEPPYTISDSYSTAGESGTANYVIQPPATNGLVFSYVYTLPSFLRAIKYFVAAVLTLRPQTLATRQGNLNDCINQLVQVHNTVVEGNPTTNDPAGLIGFPFPWAAYPAGESDAAASFVAHSVSQETHWSLVGRPYGGVEQYSGAGIVDSYDPFLLSKDSSPYQQIQAVTKLGLRIQKRMKEMYENVGMPALRAAVNDLRRLAGQSPLFVPPYYEDWSLRNLDAVIRSAYPSRPPLGTTPPDSIIGFIGSFLDTTSPFPSPSPYLSNPGPWSLRAMLTGHANGA